MANSDINRQQSMAIEVLDQLGITQPSSRQIAHIETLLFATTIKTDIYFAPQLSKREISCLYWSAKGKTSEEIAKLLHIQKQTVDSYKKEIKRKLGSRNIAQAVFEGIRWGYIQPISSHPINKEAEFKNEFN